jgi:peptidoglycan/LPS O-acetylase OafA/YrhL
MERRELGRSADRLSRTDGATDSGPGTVLYFALTPVFAAAAFHALESPCIELGRRLSGARRHEALAAVPAALNEEPKDESATLVNPIPTLSR